MGACSAVVRCCHLPPASPGRGLASSLSLKMPPFLFQAPKGARRATSDTRTEQDTANSGISAQVRGDAGRLLSTHSQGRDLPPCILWLGVMRQARCWRALGCSFSQGPCHTAAWVMLRQPLGPRPCCHLRGGSGPQRNVGGITLGSFLSAEPSTCDCRTRRSLSKPTSGAHVTVLLTFKGPQQGGAPRPVQLGWGAPCALLPTAAGERVSLGGREPQGRGALEGRFPQAESSAMGTPGPSGWPAPVTQAGERTSHCQLHQSPPLAQSTEHSQEDKTHYLIKTAAKGLL